jgi:hypothetical protein
MEMLQTFVKPSKFFASGASVVQIFKSGAVCLLFGARKVLRPAQKSIEILVKLNLPF